MENTPKSLRLQIAVAGRVNSGKSSLLNRIAGQEVAITSPLPGTTTDVVEKAMELRPLGPVLFLDTAGLDDLSALGDARVRRSLQALNRADVLLIVTVPGLWGEPEKRLLEVADSRGIAAIPVINKSDLGAPAPEFSAELQAACRRPPLVVSALHDSRDALLEQLKTALISAVPDEFVAPPPLLADLINPGDSVVLIVPVDIQAPRGRLILPQVQALRDVLDANAVAHVCKETGYVSTLSRLTAPPALVVCDSQAVDLMVRETPPGIFCTTFSILLARLKGDLEQLSSGAAAIAALRSGDRVLIAEACTHHASGDDIGRVKIPRLLEKKSGAKLEFTVVSGHDLPADLTPFKLMVHCGACMLNRRETLHRIQLAAQAGVPTVNYGVAISYCKGVLDRVMEPFRR